MPTYGTSFGADYPTIGQSGATEAADLNDLLLDIVTCLEAKVTPSGFSINADLDHFGDYGPISLRKAAFDNQVVAVTDNNALYFSGNELKVNTNGGTVQITNNGSLNFAATGAITGTGYGSSGKEVNWDNSNLRYKMKSGSGSDDYANVLLNAVLFNDDSGNFLTLATPALAGDYTITFPNAVPAATARLVVGTGGALSYETAAESMMVHAIAGEAGQAGGTGFSNAGSSGYALSQNAGDSYATPITLPVGYRLKSVTFHYRRAGGTVTFYVYKIAVATGTLTQIATGTIVAGTADSSTSIDFTDELTANTHHYFVQLTAGAAAERFYGIQVFYDKIIS